MPTHCPCVWIPVLLYSNDALTHSVLVCPELFSLPATLLSYEQGKTSHANVGVRNGLSLPWRYRGKATTPIKGECVRSGGGRGSGAKNI